MQKKIILRPEGHYILQENLDGSVLIEKNLQYRLLLEEAGLISIENALTGRKFSTRREQEG